jgi:hypothetical protein
MSKTEKATKTVASVEKATKTVADTVVVSWKGNTREYSEKLHGADFAKLAKEFAEKVDGKVA